MAISGITDPAALTGAPVTGSDGDKLGKVDAIYYDNDTEQPEWAAVKSGLFGSHVSLVPLHSGSWDGSTLTVPFDKAALKAAPHHDPDASISPTDEEELYRHYGRGAGGRGAGHGADGRTDHRGRPASSATTPPARPPTTR